MKHRWFWRSIVVFSTLLILGATTALGTDDNHKTNVKYLMWKHHLYPYSGELALRYFNVDVDFRMSLYGKSKKEVQRWFPVLQPINHSDSYLQYCGDEVKQPGFVWIDGTRWGILFEMIR
jgi:hypothetical protein